MIDSGSEHINSYCKILESLNADIFRISKLFNKEAKRMANPINIGNQKALQNIILSIYSGMRNYSKGLVLKIPKLSSEFSDAMMHVLRAVELVKHNNLEETFQLSGISSEIQPLREVLIDLAGKIDMVKDAMKFWPDENADLHMQKMIILALHDDLASSVLKSVELLDHLFEEIHSTK